MDSTNLIIIINIIVLIFAFFIKCIHDSYHQKKILHPKLDLLFDTMQQITNPKNNLLLTNNDVVNKLENILD